jgi:hypothetical protein
MNVGRRHVKEVGDDMFWSLCTYFLLEFELDMCRAGVFCVHSSLAFSLVLAS